MSSADAVSHGSAQGEFGEQLLEDLAVFFGDGFCGLAGPGRLPGCGSTIRRCRAPGRCRSRPTTACVKSHRHDGIQLGFEEMPKAIFAVILVSQ